MVHYTHVTYLNLVTLSNTIHAYTCYPLDYIKTCNLVNIIEYYSVESVNTTIKNLI